jgi:hypothetical protein
MFFIHDKKYVLLKIKLAYQSSSLHLFVLTDLPLKFHAWQAMQRDQNVTLVLHLFFEMCINEIAADNSRNLLLWT